MIVAGSLPVPDVGVIADTGRERKSTWDYLDGVLNPALAQVGFKVERVKAAEYGYGGTSEFSPKGDLLIPAFTSQTAGDVGKLSAFCNRWWKLDAVRVYLSKVHGITRSKYRSWVGYSFDEQRRWARMMQGEEYQKGLMWFPLVDKGIKRHEAIRAVERAGWPSPPRSACWMCPNQSDEEWRDLRDTSPDEFAKAVQFDADIRAKDPHAWLHKSCKPLSDVDFSEAPELFSRACDSGACFI